MKKLSLFALIALLSLTQTQAQLKKGEIMLGANFTVISDKVETDNDYETQKQLDVGIIPQLAFGLGKNWIAGVGVGYNLTKLTSDLYDSEQKVHAFVFGVFARKFFTFNDQFGIFGQLNVGAGFGKGEQNNTSGPAFDAKNTTISAGIQPGLYFRPNKRFVIDAVFGNIGYTHTKTEYESGSFLGSKRSQFQFSLTEALAIGFKIVL